MLRKALIVISLILAPLLGLLVVALRDNPGRAAAGERAEWLAEQPVPLGFSVPQSPLASLARDLRVEEERLKLDLD